MLATAGVGPIGCGRSRAVPGSAGTRAGWSLTARRSSTCQRSCRREHGYSPPGRAARPTPPTRTPSQWSGPGCPGCGRWSPTTSVRCCGCLSTGALTRRGAHPQDLSAAPVAGRADPGRGQARPVRRPGQGAPGHRPAARRRRQDPTAGRRRVGRGARADRCPEEGRERGATALVKRHRHQPAGPARHRPDRRRPTARRDRRHHAVPDQGALRVLERHRPDRRFFR